jgi:HK97 family phage major capsid protein
MKKAEQKKTEIQIQIRALQEDITNGKIKADAAKQKFEQLRTSLSEVEKEIALTKAPVGRGSNASPQVADIITAMREKRAITLNGTGAINQIKELFKELQKKTPILEKVRVFHGQNANTNIPILSPSPALPSGASEGSTSIGVDGTAVLGSKNLTPFSWVSILPISVEALSLGSIDIESELPTIFADAFAQSFHKEILTGSGTGLHFQGLFTNIPTDNKIACSSVGNPTITDLQLLALSISDLTDDACIILNPSIYSGIIAKSSNDIDKILIEELVRNKTIEGVQVVITSAAPNTTTAGSVVAVAGKLDNYGLAMASEIQIEPIKKVGDTNTYFQAVVFANGSKIIDKNFYGLVTVSA